MTVPTEVFPLPFPCPFAEACHRQGGEGFGGAGRERELAARRLRSGLWRAALARLCVPHTDVVTHAACVFKAL